MRHISMYLAKTRKITHSFTINPYLRSKAQKYRINALPFQHHLQSGIQGSRACYHFRPAGQWYG